MARLFITLYLGIIGSCFAFLITAEETAKKLSYDVDVQTELNRIHGYVILLSALRDTTDEVNFRAAFDRAGAVNGVLITEVVEPQILGAASVRDVVGPATLFDLYLEADNPIYLRLEGDPRLFRVSEDPNAPIWQKADLLQSIILWGLATVIGLISLVWFFYLHRKLKRLEHATGQIAAGDFSARVPERGRHRVGGLNQAFNRMASRVEQLIASHKRLTNAVAHELRTPIFRIRCQLALLEPKVSDEEVQQRVAGIETDVDELEQMVDELLTYARMERSEVTAELTALNLADWITQQLSHLQRSAEKPIHWQRDNSNLQTEIDSRLLLRALTNLIRNADRYATDTIQLSLAQQGERVQIHLDDDGPGIPAADRARVLQPFERLDSARDRNSGGYGLGLSIVREIAIAHHGALHIEDSPLGGARLIIELPIAPATQG